MPRWKNQQQTSDAVQELKRTAVIREAGLAFSRRGYHNTSLDDVAKALHVSKGTLYNYIKDKQEILFECHKQAYEVAQKAMELGRLNVTTGADRLAKTLKLYIQLLVDTLGACSVLMEIDGLRPKDRVTAINRRDEFQRQIIAIIESGIDDGSLVAADPHVVVFTMMGAVNWIPRWYSPEGKLTGEQIAERMTEILMSGLRRKPA